jgi:hypothetical protein
MARRAPTRPAPRCRPRFERLEDRIAPTINWTGGSGNFNDPTHWIGGVVPGPSDNAVIDVSGVTVTYSSGSRSVHSVTCNDAFVLSGGSLTVAAPSTIHQLTMKGGALSLSTGAAGLSLSGASTLLQGTLRAAPGATVTNTGTLSVAVGWTLNASSSVGFINDGTLDKTGTGPLTIPASFVNAGTVEVQGGILTLAGGGKSNGSFLVDAQFTLSFASTYQLMAGSKVSGAGITSFSWGSVTVDGFYNVTGGTVVAGGTANFISPVTSVGSLIVAHGTANFSTSSLVTVPTLTLEEGTLTGSDNVVITGSMDWLSGTMSGTGGTLLQPGTQVTFIEGTLDTRSLGNKGSFTTAAGSVLTLAHGAAVGNAGTWTDEGGNGVTGTGTFNNSAKYVNSGSGTTSYKVPFNNAGTAEVQSGTMNLGGGGRANVPSTGTGGIFQIDAGALLTISSGAYVLNPGTQVVGAGFADVTGATATIAGTVSAAKFELDSGLINGPGDLDVSDTFTWTGGKLQGTGMVNLGSTALANVSVPGTSVLPGQRTITAVQDIVVTRPSGAGTGIVQLGSYPENASASLLPTSLYLCSFTDGSRPAPASAYTASISWGDKGTSLGTITPNKGGFDVASSAHHYTEEGTYSVHVQISGGFGESAHTAFTEQVTITDAPLGGVARSATLPPMKLGSSSFSSIVATFWDPGSDGTTADYSASINWGGGPASAAQIAAVGNGLFNVTASHAYPVQPLPYSVTISDKGGATASFAGELFPAIGLNVIAASATDSTVVEGAHGNTVVASFIGPGAASAYQATIVWPGTNTSTAATIQQQSAGGPFQVVTQRTFNDVGYAGFDVIINKAGKQVAAANGIVTVTEAPITAVAHNFTATAGNVVLALPASFSDPAYVAGQTFGYRATIDWGDGTTSGSIAYTTGSGNVTGNHVYAKPGSYKVRTTVLAGDGGAVEADATATVTSTTVTALGQNVTAYWDVPFTSAVATFSDQQVGTSPANYTAAIDWQASPSALGTDTSVGKIVANGDGTFSVVGTHTYHNYAAFPVYVTIRKATGGLVATAVTAADVGVGVHPINLVEGSAYNQPIAAFPNLIPSGANPALYQAVINWGDGHLTIGTIAGTQDPLGAWIVSAPAHTYTEAGGYTVTITVTNPARATVATATDTAIITDGPLTLLGGTKASPQAGYPATLTAATFADHTADKAKDYSATINWGDGQTSLATIVPARSPAGQTNFSVIGTHTYAVHGTYTLSGIVFDVGGAVVPFSSTIQVTFPPLQIQGASFAVKAGSAFTGVVTSFFAGDQSITASDFTKSTIDWQDGGTPTSVTVSAVAGHPGHFTVTAGPHTFATAGVYNLALNLVDSAGPGANVSPRAVVGSAPAVAVGPLSSFITTSLRTLQTDLDTNVFNNPVPLVGSQLTKAPVGQVMTTLQAVLSAAFAQLDTSQAYGLQGALFEALGPDGLNVLEPADGSARAATIADVGGTQDANGNINYEVKLLLDPSNNQGRVAFALALPGVPLHLNDNGSGSVNAGVGYTLDLKFGSTTGTTPVPYVNPSVLNVTVAANAAGMSISGSDALLTEQAQDDASNPSSFNGTYTVDFSTAYPHALLVVSGAALNATSAINLKLDASFSPGAGGALNIFNPHLLGELNAQWNFQNADPSVYPFGNSPTVQVNNVQLDLNSFFSSFVAPLVADMQQVTKPLEPLAQFLLTPIPVLTDVTQFLGLGPATPARLVALGGAAPAPLTALATAIDLINHLPVPDVGGTINLGGFTMKDPRAKDAQGNPAYQGQMSLPPIEPPEPVTEQEQSGPESESGFFLNVSKISLDFPILDDPTQAFKLLLGQDATLFTFNVPKVGIGVNFSWSLPVPMPPPLTGLVSLQVQVQIDLTAGGTFTYDTSGLRAGNPAAGFYMQNVSFALSVQVSPGLQIGIPHVVALTFEIDVTATFTETLVDSANGNSTTIPATDFSKVKLQPSFALTADLAFEVDIFNDNCLFKLIIGSVTWDATGTHYGGITTGC